MALGIDAQVLAEMAPLLAAVGDIAPAPVGDVESRRVNGHRMFDSVAAAWAPAAGIEVTQYSLSTDDGTTLRLGWYHRAAAQPGSAALYLHGGGMIFGLEHIGRMYDAAVRDYVAASGVPMLVVDYRIAPEHPHPTPVEDCFAALSWLAGNAATLGVDPARIAVMGDSAGGGLAAAVCLLARDRGGPAIAAQILIYPMLDDRPITPDPALMPYLTWTYDDNLTGWGALLGADAGTDSVPPYAAPARATDLRGLPDTYLDVGDLDIFRNEDISYARRLADAGVPTELHVYPGCPHAFEALARNAGVSRRAISDRVRRLRSL
ncbi:alpha/beta hydrolase [Mycolicibacterium celeriflavum]|uniref:Alpha/beta hydrolase n=1 Tax=Mycolicibacterium celeriflavum TaxID=1249101 RepID=A0A1X0BU74_MYCCF|nr:alpha/beta hydrolase [Mycolicibacterium celeriflavum]MCV7240839.1 alpha/beta hydrolase [Mycolicibacterium celeriflavum]OBG14514.1 alpha/beta hydrolase [Mycolicibacterium celeriflavum]ORA47504.1 alpha/beta hydrolase [Mycolicibacterium celeriflavum]BBY42456.1 alpha/beta hydrolase [Mycolicibacterium celeriflavum]